MACGAPAGQCSEVIMFAHVRSGPPPWLPGYSKVARPFALCRQWLDSFQTDRLCVKEPGTGGAWTPGRRLLRPSALPSAVVFLGYLETGAAEPTDSQD